MRHSNCAIIIAVCLACANNTGCVSSLLSGNASTDNAMREALPGERFYSGARRLEQTRNGITPGTGLPLDKTSVPSRQGVSEKAADSVNPTPVGNGAATPSTSTAGTHATASANSSQVKQISSPHEPQPQSSANQTQPQTVSTQAVSTMTPTLVVGATKQTPAVQFLNAPTEPTTTESPKSAEIVSPEEATAKAPPVQKEKKKGVKKSKPARAVISDDDDEEAPSEVAQSSYLMEPEDEDESESGARDLEKDWRKLHERTLQSLRAEAQKLRGAPETAAEAARLDTIVRLQEAIAGQRDDAARPIEGLSRDEQEFWKQHAFAMVDLLSEDRPTSENRRFALALQALEEANLRLAERSSLSLRNLAFCTKVNDFGQVEKFDRAEFKPNQEVVLYVEVKNFVAKKSERGQFETELQGSFRILDRSGVARAERALPLDKQVCANYRRDYFIAYLIYIPQELEPGSYTLELTLEDKKGSKSSNALTPLQVIR